MRVTTVSGLFLTPDRETEAAPVTIVPSVAPPPVDRRRPIRHLRVVPSAD